MNVPDVAEAQAWYAKYFGALPVPHEAETVADIPGSPIVFAESRAAVPTKGRALDRLGIEVKNLEEVVRQLENSGAHFDNPANPVVQARSMTLKVALITDPWGTYIELSEGLAAVK